MDSLRIAQTDKKRLLFSFRLISSEKEPIMIKIGFFTICLIVSIQNDARGELYKYVDKNGILQITDNPSNIPADQALKKDEKYNVSNQSNPSVKVQQTATETKSDKCEIALDRNLQACRNAIAIALQKTDKPGTSDQAKAQAALFCRDPRIKNRLTSQERENVNLMSQELEKSKNQYELDEMAAYFLKDCYEVNKKYSKQELEKLDDSLKHIWKDMIAALAKNDVEQASSYFFDSFQETWKNQFEALPANERIKFAHTLAENKIAIVSAEGNQATYEMLTTKEGELYSFQLMFVKNVYGIWKIHSF